MIIPGETFLYIFGSFGVLLAQIINLNIFTCNHTAGHLKSVLNWLSRMYVNIHVFNFAL